MTLTKVRTAKVHNTLTGKDVWDCTLVCGHRVTAPLYRHGRRTQAPQRLKCGSCAAQTHKEPQHG